jgi:homoserine/homoserine lactone efflux protein
MSIEIILIFAATEFLFSLAPGPAVLLVVGQGMRFGFSSSDKASLGILTGNAVYLALSAFGLGGSLTRPASRCALARTRVGTVTEYLPMEKV